MVGFLKFLKRGKKQEDLGEIDLPPTPPPLEDFGDDFPDFHDFGEENAAPTDEYSAKIDFPKDEMRVPDAGDEKKMQDFPVFPKIEESQMEPIAQISVPQATLEPVKTMQQPSMMPEQEIGSRADKEAFRRTEAYKKPADKIQEEDAQVLRQNMSIKEVYVRIDKFKNALGGINAIRNDLRKNEEAMAKLENIKSTKDRSIEKVKFCMDDLQKKLIFVDKTLFKGE